MADGSRNNPADVHRTSRTSLQFHHNNRHNVSHPIPKHTDKSQHRTPHHNPRTQNPLGTTFHIQYRSIQTKVSTVSHTTTQELLKKSPRGVQRGHGFMAPLRFSSFPTKTPKNIFLPTFPSKVCRKINKILVVFTIKKVYHIKINYKQ